MDSAFRRVPARRQLEEVSTRLSNLQKSLGLDQLANLSTSAQNLRDASSNTSTHGLQWRSGPQQSPTSSSARPSSNSLSPSESRTGGRQWLMLDNPREEGSWPIGDMILHSNTVLALFEHFDTTLDPHLPILEPCTSLYALYQSSATLFWTIVLVACRENPLYRHLYDKLAPFVRDKLSLKLMDLPHSLTTLHAILLVCLWPFPVRSQADDPSWLWSGSAVNIAMMMGLHKPGHEMEYGRPMRPHNGDIRTRKATWLAVFQVSTSLSSWFGMPPTLNSTSHLETIATLCRDPTVPKAMAASVDIQHQVARYMTTLDGQLEVRTKNALIKLFEQDLDRLRVNYEDVWSEALDIELLGAKLYLYGMSFVWASPYDIEQSQTEPPELSSRSFLYRGFAAAVRLLHTVCQFKVAEDPRSPMVKLSPNSPKRAHYISQLSFFPKQFFRMTAFATFFLLWFLAIDLGASEADRELAKNYVSGTHRLFMSFTNSPEHIRCGQTFEVIGRMPSITDGNPALRVNTRLGASFMYDIIRNTTLYREATRHAQEAQVPLPQNHTEREPSSTEILDLDHDTSRLHRQYNVPEGSIHEMDLDNPPRIVFGSGNVPESDMIFHQNLSPRVFEGLTPNRDFPWGVWDDALYDSLGVDMNLSQLQSYNDATFM
ncbi:hypothetical protein MMC11_003838 [Xylographa trunciseda]|nr:hypothetical protein [Xylographa trunciseda]